MHSELEGCNQRIKLSRKDLGANGEDGFLQVALQRALPVKKFDPLLPMPVRQLRLAPHPCLDFCSQHLPRIVRVVWWLSDGWL